MRITCTLSDAIRILCNVRAASTTQSLPILRGVLFLAEDNQITLSTCNLICGITITLSGKTEKSGEGATPLEPLLLCLESVLHTHTATERITFYDDGTAIVVQASSGQSHFLERLDPKEFPRPFFDDATTPARELCTLSARTLKDSIAQVLFAADPDPYAGQLSCVWVQKDRSGIVTFAAADRWRIAVQTVHESACSSDHAAVFLIPGETLATLLPCLAPCDGQMTLLVDRVTLHIRTQSTHIVARLYEEIRRDTIRAYGEPIVFSGIPFVQHLPSQYAWLLHLPTAKLKTLLRKQDLLHWSFSEEQGQWQAVIERYGMQKQKKGTSITLPVQVWGKPPEDLWLSSWMLAEIVATPGISPTLVLAIDDSVPAKILVRWCDAGKIRQDVSYAMLAQDPYLAKLSTILSTPLSKKARQVLDQLLRGHNRWADKTLWHPALARTLLLIEQSMRPTEQEIQRIIPHPERLTEKYEQLTQIRNKRKRERRLDWLLTQIAIQAFSPQGATFTVNGSEQLHVQASILIPLLQVDPMPIDEM